jgi:hypothetical protein
MHHVYFANSYIGCSEAVHRITMIDYGVELSSVLGAFRFYCRWVFSKIRANFLDMDGDEASTGMILES